ncbi:hypothetical protein OBP_287 [Pseudomonas phage OBP]|uniref:hypothetical protein n=1 Tax=Pseudomonas phage OBP TaxID=1124849 RepID=UPI000240D63A|nr:hypothetical protein OBP_287 [Pseudomonas phage OBP]AEV89724.1 hypothetical protein OBP_287 [Pseudomonas phage OBP]
MTTTDPKTKLNKFEETNLLEALHNNSRRTTSILHTGNACFLQCWYPNFDLGIPSMKGPVCQIVYNGGKRSPFMDMTDAGKLLALAKQVRSHDWKMFPGYEGTHELKTTRVKLTWNKLWFVDARCPRFQTGDFIPTDKFLVNLIGSLIMFIAGGKGVDEYPVSAVGTYADMTHKDELFAVTDFGYSSVNSKPSWLKYTATKSTKSGSLVMTYGEVQFHIKNTFTRGVDWEFFIGQIAKAVIDVACGDHQYVEVFLGHPVLDKYNTYVRKYVEGDRTFMVINSDIHAYNNKVMFMLGEKNTQHLKDFFTTIINYHK